MIGIAFSGALSVRCNLVFAVSLFYPPGPDHLSRDLNGANRVVASWTIQPVISDHEVAI